MADKVVRRLADTSRNAINDTQINAKPLASPISSVMQTKSLKNEDELQRKEEDDLIQKFSATIQREPVFDGGGEKPDDDDLAVQKKCQECEKEDAVQRKPASGISSDESFDVESNLNSSKNSGSPIAPDARRQMENSFGTDFSDVRVHTDNKAVQMSKALNAQAFTHKDDVYFNSGKYDPHGTEGKKLLAHELTHTVQQGAAVRRKPAVDANQKAGAKEETAPTTSEVVDISSGLFAPSDRVKEEIQKAGNQGIDVRVMVPSISGEGKIKIRVDSRGNFDAVNGQRGYMPVLNEWAKQLGGLYLRFTVKDNAITGGFVSPSLKGGNASEWIKKFKENSALLGGLGLKVGKLPDPVNEFSGSTFRIGFTEGQVEVGGIVDAKFNFSLENGSKPRIDAIADVNVKGVAKGQLVLDNTKERLTGEVSLAVEFKDFTGNVNVKYNEDGSIDIHGKATYNANKLSGEIDLVSTDVQSANNFAKDAIKAAGGKENVQNAAPPQAAPAPKEGKKDRALAAVGQLQFHLTDWFAGTVNVIVDGKGDITVIGKIAPPAEVELFKQKDYDKELVSLEVEAGYGIPVVGTIGVFAGVSLSAVAYIGPAKLYNIEILGTYSTDPEVQKSIQISGSINISAYAGLRLRAEGGAKLTVVSHDLKLGVGVNADVGVKAYADARPTIGYREPGEFYISGTAEMVAQPMLGLSGDFFIELDAPWWSPIDDDRWVWPIGSKEWPLSDPIGLSATMKDYVLGSGTAPDIEFKKPEFDPSKFMTKMVDKELPEKAGDSKGGKGEFKEDGSIAKPEIPDPNAVAADVGAGGKQAGGAKVSPFKDKQKKPQPDAKAQQEAMLLFSEGAKKLVAVKGPLSKADLRKELDKIEVSVPGLRYQVRLDSNHWKVTSYAKGVDNPKPFRVSAIVTDEDKKEEHKEATLDTISAALQEIETEGKKEIDEGEVTVREAEGIKNKVNADHPSVIKISSVRDGGPSWDFEYVQLSTASISKGSVAMDDVKVGAYYKTSDGKDFFKILSVGKPYVMASKVRDGKEVKLNLETFLKAVTEKRMELTTKAEISKITPEKRYLPVSWNPGNESIRPALYLNPGWTERSKTKRDAEVSGIQQRVARVQKTIKPSRLDDWKELENQGKVDPDADIDNYSPFMVSYDVDHEPDLAISWNEKGDNNSDDEARRFSAMSESNLRVVTKRYNLTKGRKKYFLWVGKDFESAKANTPKDSRTINGERYLDAANGNPIP